MTKASESAHLLGNLQDKPLELLELKRPLVISLIFALIGPFLFGYNEAVLNTSHSAIVDSLCSATASNCFSDRQWSLILYIYLVGGAPGAFLAGGLFRRFGFVRASLISAAFMFVGTGLTLGAVSPAMFIVGRVVAGFAAGMSTVLAPIYIADISHASYRGFLGVLYQLFITLGIFTSVILGLSDTVGNERSWRVMFALPPALCVLQLILSRFVTESPVWLCMYKGSHAQAKEALRQVLHTSVVDEKMGQIESEAPKARQCYTIEVFKEYTLRRSLKEVVVLALVQQLSGINATFFFSTKLFAEIGISDNVIVAIVICSVNTLMTLIPLFVIDRKTPLFANSRLSFRLGRKGLLMCSFVGMTIGYAVITPALVNDVGVLAVASNVFVIASFAVGLGPIPWLKVSEVSDYQWRSSVASVAVSLNWIANFLVAFTSWELLSLTKDYVFAPYILFTFVCCLFVPWCFVETAGLETHTIAQQYHRLTSSSAKSGMLPPTPARLAAIAAHRAPAPSSPSSVNVDMNAMGRWALGSSASSMVSTRSHRTDSTHLFSDTSK